MPTTYVLVVNPSPKKNPNDINATGRFDAVCSGAPIVLRTRTPFCDGARELLARGLAAPGDRLEMRHAGGAPWRCMPK